MFFLLFMNNFFILKEEGDLRKIKREELTIIFDIVESPDILRTLDVLTLSFRFHECSSKIEIKFFVHKRLQTLRVIQFSN